MESMAARPVRILTEYLDPLARIRKAGVGDTIVMFGSARILPRDRALANLERLKRSGGRRKVRGGTALSDARAVLKMSRYYEEARELARRLTTWSSDRSGKSHAVSLWCVPVVALGFTWKPPIAARPKLGESPSV